MALPLPAELRARLAEAIASLRLQVAVARFVATEGVHLTLRFLGPSRPEQLQRLRPALAAAAGACPPLPVRVAGLGTFPGRGAPRVLWAACEAPPELVSLQAACEQAARGAGFEPERRPFRPHLTLARWRATAPATRCSPLFRCSQARGDRGGASAPMTAEPLPRRRAFPTRDVRRRDRVGAETAVGAAAPSPWRGGMRWGVAR